MINKILESIENLVASIYDIDQIGLQEKYLTFLENIEQFIGKMTEMGYQVDMNKDLMEINDAMEKKDYIWLSDILLYTVKPDFENLRKMDLNI